MVGVRSAKSSPNHRVMGRHASPLGVQLGRFFCRAETARIVQIIPLRKAMEDHVPERRALLKKDSAEMVNVTDVLYTRE